MYSWPPMVPSTPISTLFGIVVKGNQKKSEMHFSLAVLVERDLLTLVNYFNQSRFIVRRLPPNMFILP